MSSIEARAASLASWAAGREGTMRVYTNPEGWTIGKGRCDNGWTIQSPDGVSPHRETYRSLLAAQLRVADYMGI